MRSSVDLQPPLSLPVTNLSAAMPVQSHPAAAAAALQLSSLQSEPPPKTGGGRESKAEVRRARR